MQIVQKGTIASRFVLDFPHRLVSLLLPPPLDRADPRHLSPERQGTGQGEGGNQAGDEEEGGGTVGGSQREWGDLFIQR